MAPIKSSLARTVGRLLGVQKDTDLSLRGATQSTRVPPPVPITATGGTKNTSVGDGYIYHVYEQTGVGSPNTSTFQITAGNDVVEVLVIGGGGGAGSMPSGSSPTAPTGRNGGNPGGGGGGAAVGPVGSLGPGSYPVTVGAGGKGRGATSDGPPAYNPSDTFATAGEAGGTSSFVAPGGTIQATGGAGGPANASSPLPATRAPGGTGSGGTTNGTGGYGGHGVAPGSPGQGAGENLSLIHI